MDKTAQPHQQDHDLDDDTDGRCEGGQQQEIKLLDLTVTTRTPHDGVNDGDEVSINNNRIDMTGLAKNRRQRVGDIYDYLGVLCHPPSPPPPLTPLLLTSPPKHTCMATTTAVGERRDEVIADGGNRLSHSRHR